MYVLAFNASPRKERGNTHRILSRFMEGAAQGGATVETLYVRDLCVKPCMACMSCWFRTPKKCAQEDDMGMVLEKVRKADALVLATPVYVDGMVGAMKVLLDRMIPLVMPEMEIRDDHMRHPPVPDKTCPKIVLVSVCGLHEPDNFHPLVAHIQAMCKNMASEYAGALLRPHAHAMEALENFHAPPTELYDACRQAGVELATSGRVPESLLQQIGEPLMPREAYLHGANDAIAKLRVKHGSA